MKQLFGRGGLQGAILTAGLVAACAPASNTTPAAPSLAVSAAPSAAPNPAPAAGTKLERACAALAQKNRPGAVPLQEANPAWDEDPQPPRPLDAEDLYWDSVGRCHFGEGGAWAIDVKAGQRRVAGDVPLIRLDVALVHLSPEGVRSEAPLELVSSYFEGLSPKPLLEVAGVMDLVQGPSAEVALCIDSDGQEFRGPNFYVPHPVRLCSVFTWLGPDADENPEGGFSIEGVDTPYSRRFVDADSDGRLDLVAVVYNYPGRPGYCSLKGSACPEGLEETGPQLLYHAVGGRFDPSDAVAKQYARTLCPAAPTAASFKVSSSPVAADFTQIMQHTGCAILWHVPRADLESWLGSAAQQMCEDPDDCEEFSGFTAWMNEPPPLNLSVP